MDERNERPELSDFSVLIDELVEKLEGWAFSAVKLLPNLVVALLVFLLMWFVARGMSRLARRALDRISHNKEVNQIAEIMARVALTSVGLFLALSILNLDGVVTSLLAGVGVVGIALGFAFQDIASNFMAGVMLAVRRPIRVGDLVKTGDYFGVVEGMDLRATHLRTTTGELVIIPNKSVFENPIINYTETPDRRIDLKVGVAYGDDLRKAQKVVETALAGLEVRNPERPVEVFFEEFGDSSINFKARFWIRHKRQGEYMAARSEAVIAIKEALDAAGLTIPFPIRTLDFGARAVGGLRLDEVLGVERPES